MRIFFLPILLFFFICGCGEEKRVPNFEKIRSIKETPRINYKVVAETPHDTTSFTQGLVFHNKQLFESTGSPDQLPKTRSVLGIVNLANGKIDKKAEIDRNIYFGEGITFLNGKIFQLTYLNQICFIYDEKTFKRTGEFKFANKEGWGLTNDDRSLIMSDGTNMITYIDPQTYQVIKTITVTDINNNPIVNLNELEYIKGYIYANVYGTADIVKIDPLTGKVVGRLDLKPVDTKTRMKSPLSYEMNGIAYDSLSKKMFITGKMWPSIYQLDFEH